MPELETYMSILKQYAYVSVTRLVSSKVTQTRVKYPCKIMYLYNSWVLR